MAEYMLIIKGDEQAAAKMTQEEGQKVMAAYRKYTDDLLAAKKMVHGAPLMPSSGGARVQLKAGKRTVVDGPFAESKEVVGGYYLIEAASKQEAIEWAGRCPAVEHGGVMEVREVMVIPGM